MKIEMYLKNNLSWEIKLYPETESELVILKSIKRGYGVKCEVCGTEDSPENIIITGEGNKMIPIEVSDE